jgi:hypothetical protein
MLWLKAMQKEHIVQYLPVIIVVTLLSIALIISTTTNSYKIIVQDAFSIPPSFQRQEITLGSGNWFNLTSGRPASSGPSYIDIQSISYFSNGKYLNATLWLGDFVTSPNEFENVNYGIYFDADSNNRTGLSGIDYKAEIGWSNETKTWTRVLEEWSSNGKSKVLDPKQNVTDFFGEGGSYVTLNADLDSILSPDNYRVLFYAEVYDAIKRFYWIIDSTNWISIPSPELALTVLPNPIILIQGEQYIAEVRINSSTPDELDVDLNLPQNRDNSNPITTRIDSEKFRIPPFGVASTPLRVYIPPDIAPTGYMIMMRANITARNTPLFADYGLTQQPVTQEGSANNGKNPSITLDEYVSKIITDQTVSKSSVFSIQVREWKFDEQLNNFVNQWITPLTAIYTSISSIAAGILGWIYGRRRGKRRRKRNGNSNNQDNNNNS